MKLFEPSRCTADLPKDLSKEYLVAEEKLDGSRYLLYIGYDPYERRKGNTLLSRRLSTYDNKFVDKTDNLSHVTHLVYSNLTGTVLDGEVMGESFLATTAALNSRPNKSLKLDFHAFDVLMINNQDIRSSELTNRRKILEQVVAQMKNEHVKIIPQKTPKEVNFKNHFEEIVNSGGEGLIIKDSRCAYGNGWAKMKKVFDVSCVISGWKPGTGKYRGTIGSIELAVFHKDKLVDVGFCSGFDDKLRMEMRRNFKKFEGSVVDVFVQEMQESTRSELGRFRHATFHRLREDLRASDCTYSKLCADMKRAQVGRTK